MQIHRILDVRDEECIFLAEESLSDLIDLPATKELLSSRIDADSAIEIGGGLGIALHFSQPQEFWLLLTDRYSMKKVLRGFSLQHKGMMQRTVDVREEDFFEALVECLSLSLAAELLCERCDVKAGPPYGEDRVKRLASFLEPLIRQGERLLEICCGNGIATQSLYRLGHRPLSVDLDRCDICQGLKGGLLDPRRSLVMDARRLGQLFAPGSFDAVIGFMIGLIDDLNWSIWKEIILISSGLSRRMVLYTVYTQREAELIAKALQMAGWRGEIIDNRDIAGIYDQWAVLARKEH